MWCHHPLMGVSTKWWFTLGEDPLVEFDMVEHRAETPVLNQGVSGHLAVVHHACKEYQERIRRLFTIHSLIWNPGLLWQHHSCKIIEKSGGINKESTPAAEEKTKIKDRTNVVHLKNSNGNKGREVLIPVYLFHCCHFLLELTYNQSVLSSVWRQYPRLTESILKSCSKHIEKEKVKYSNNINVSALRSGLVLSLSSVGRSAAKTTNKPFRKSKSTNSPS